MNLIGTHDTERILTVLGGEDSTGKTNAYLINARLNNEERKIAKEKLFMAYAISATLPGIPSIFYGDEVGMEGYSDPFNRRTFPWGKEDEEILTFYKTIGKIRRDNSVYKKGQLLPLIISNEVLAFARIDKNSRLISFVNNSDTEKILNFKKNAEALISNQTSKTVKILPHTVEIIKTYEKSFTWN